MTIWRWAGAKDAAALHTLFFIMETWDVFYPRFMDWLRWQERGRMVYMLVEREGQLVGQGQLFLGPGTRGEIANVNVAAAYQNQGIGTTILNRLVQYAQIHAYTVVEISVAISNHRAQALYQRLGFVVDRPLHSAYDEASLVMKMVIKLKPEEKGESAR